jgi:hypothetical protein
MAARSSSDFASWRRATSRARCTQASASACDAPRLPQEQDAPQATDFRFPVAFLLLLHQGVGLNQRLKAVFRVAQVGRDFRQQCAIVCEQQRCLSSSGGGDPLAYLGHPSLTLALHGQRPPAQDRSRGRPEWAANCLSG